MNHSYRLVWSDATQRYVPAPETARGRGKSRTAKALAPVALLLGTLLALPAGAQVLPMGGVVVSAAGSATIHGPNPIVPHLMRIEQLHQKAILEWQSFNIAKGYKVQFDQPNATAVALNRVIGGGYSEINGQLDSNGQVWLVNPNGVMFGQDSVVNVGGLVASTLGITNKEFDAEGTRKLFTRDLRQGATNSDGSINAMSAGITNNGTITVKPGGSLALLSHTVRNGDRPGSTATLNVSLGDVVLAGGDGIVLDAGVGGRLKVEVDPATVQTLIDNHGFIHVGEGQVRMTSRAANAASGSVVSNSGSITSQADGLHQIGGRILLLSDMEHGEVVHSGHIQALEGVVETSAATVRVPDGATVTTGFNFSFPDDSEMSARGNWYTSAKSLTIGSGTSSISASTLSASLANTSVVLQTVGADMGTGDINVNAPVSWSNRHENHPLALHARGDINVNAPVSWNYDTLALHADGDINLNAAMTASNVAGLEMNYGGYRSGVGGLTPAVPGSVSTPVPGIIPMAWAPGTPAAAGSGVHLARTEQGFTGKVNFTGQNGSGASTNHLSINGQPYTILTQLGGASSNTGLDLQGMRKDLAGTYALGADIDTSATGSWAGGFAPIGNGATAFTGTFEGLGHTITNLTVDRPLQNHAGLFGNASNATLRNVGLQGGSVTGKEYVGGLVGRATSGAGATALVSNVYNTNMWVTGTNHVGGLVGENHAAGGTARIEDAQAAVAVSGSSSVGGLVGRNYATGSGEAQIDGSRATGGARGGTSVGGLVGHNLAAGEGKALISYSHATRGDVIGTGSDAGGLAGTNESRTGGMAQISESSATGLMVDSDGENSGGLVGLNKVNGSGTASISDSQTNVVVRGADFAGGLVGRNGVEGSGGARISGSTASGPVRGASNVGGLAGANEAQGGGVAEILNSDAFGKVDGTNFVGGLVGTNEAAEGSQARITNARAEGVVDGKGDHIGGLVGENHANGGLATIELSKAKGTVTVKGVNHVGGLVGKNTATDFGEALIKGSDAAGVVTGKGINTGGLVGWNSASEFGDASITGSHATGIVDGISVVGGLVGANEALALSTASIDESYATGTVKGLDDVGGLVGWNNAVGGIAVLENVEARVTAHVTGEGKNVGGLVGWNSASSSGLADISNARAYGAVESPGAYVGGLVGSNYAYGGTASISNAHAFGPMVKGGKNIGGLVGWNHASGALGLADISLVSAHAQVKDVKESNGSATNVGGLVGWNTAMDSGRASIYGATASGAVSGFSEIGGLVGANFGYLAGMAEISRSSASGVVKDAHFNAGGLVGTNVAGSAGIALISHSHAIGMVKDVQSNAGGLVGSNVANDAGMALISHSHATGMVKDVQSNAGGLVGTNAASGAGIALISQSHASESVSGYNFVGGLVGSNRSDQQGRAEISDAYATGKVVGWDYVGGLVGSNRGGNATDLGPDVKAGGTASIVPCLCHRDRGWPESCWGAGRRKPRSTRRNCQHRPSLCRRGRRDGSLQRGRRAGRQQRGQ